MISEISENWETFAPAHHEDFSRTRKINKSQLRAIMKVWLIDLRKLLFKNGFSLHKIWRKRFSVRKTCIWRYAKTSCQRKWNTLQDFYYRNTYKGEYSTFIEMTRVTHASVNWFIHVDTQIFIYDYHPYCDVIKFTSLLITVTNLPTIIYVVKF